MNALYPFSAIVGQTDMKRALILNAINPLVSGVLVRGEKGTAKSTTVRALSTLLPENQVPMVTLPLNVTEEMVIGGLDLEVALKSGQRHFRPGLLARANRGILYIDEVNLLDDHIVDIILDAAASGTNTVEREGISFSHPARFILVGTMNPEEGELRPHLLDRFGLCAEISGEDDLEARIAVLERREAFDRDPVAFRQQYAAQDAELAHRIAAARERLIQVVFPDHLSTFVAELCLQHNVAGHRADLVIRHAATALAAFEGRWETTAQDIERVARLALAHRQRDALPELSSPPPQNGDQPDQAPDDESHPSEHDEQVSDENPATPPDMLELLEELPLERPGADETPQEHGEPDGQVFDMGTPFKVRRINHRKDRQVRRGSGRRSRTRTMRQGRYVKSVQRAGVSDIAFDATVRAAAPHQQRRERDNGLAINIRDDDLRHKLRERRIGNFLLFIVDASGSMGAQARMVATKGAILTLLIDAYQKRDRVALITFRRREATVTLHPTSSVDLAVKHLRELPVGGRTPLAHGLVEGFRLLKLHLLKEASAQPIAIVITDGKANVSLHNGALPHEEALNIATKMADETRIKFVVVDTEPAGVVTFGLASRLAIQLNADYFKIEDLRAQDLIDIARRAT
ncbi:MAG: magnesium chelatase subunit D family protein [Chloroflexi bacterium]|nr:magnesium chelatase subunit D family protein [Chloroflexota bacterium]